MVNYMTSKPRIGILIPRSNLGALFSNHSLAELRTMGDCRFNETDGHLDESGAVEVLRDADIAIGSWGTVRPTGPLLEACPRLRMWEHVAGSVKAFFGPHMEGRDLVVASCAPAIADSVAEMTVGELIFGLRRLIEKNRHLMGFEDLPDPDKVNLFSSTIGVIGASQVGRRVIKLLRAFDAEILLYDPFVEQEEAEGLGVTRMTDLVELFQRSNAVTLHTPALPETRNLVGAKHFAAMPDHGVFVNTSRGTCVDEPAMVEALRSRPLFAFLDVADPRFSGPDNPLRQLPNCFLTPHIAGGPNHRMGEQTVSDIRAFLNGDSPLMAVTASQLSRLA